MNRSKRAFTLIEVLVVVSILGVLMGLVSVLVMRATSHTEKNDAKSLVEAYEVEINACTHHVELICNNDGAGEF